MFFNNNTSFPVLLNEQYWKSSIVYSTILEFQYLNCRMFIQQYWKTSIVNSQYWKCSICIVEYGVSAILVFQYCLFKNTGNLVLLIKEWVSFFLGSWGMNRSAGQTNRVNREAVLGRFVCSALRFIPHEPRKKDTHSLYLQCFQPRTLSI